MLSPSSKSPDMGVVLGMIQNEGSSCFFSYILTAMGMNTVRVKQNNSERELGLQAADLQLLAS